MTTSRHAGLKASVALCLVVGLLSGSAPAQGASEPVQALIAHYAREYGADPALLTRIAWCESRFDPAAFNPADGTVGVMQFNRVTWAELAPQIGVSGDFREAWSAASNVAVASYAIALRQTWRWRGCI